jgi:hypothetical protein
VQALAQPDTMRSAAVAAGITGLACYPRLYLWTDRPNALWFMVTLLILTSFILWSFVFGWYPPRVRRPVLHTQPTRGDWVLTCLLGFTAAVVLAVAVDPILRPVNPTDYPDSFPAWIASALFSLTLSQLFLCYAPFALFLRLFGHPAVAILLTVLLGEFLLGLQLDAASFQLELPFTLLLFVLRAFLGWAAAFLFLRGGLLLGTTWALILESRLLIY